MKKHTLKKINRIREIMLKKGYARYTEEALNEYYMINGNYDNISELQILNTCIAMAQREVD
ncbi:hypothetical protein [Clostridium chrysemydis]|uniref:hypothetical protein n=1 Tax=Clostridium chrysemydis TaxID=2665504 RepID=UPI0018837945|nr:hypothetical protein [Clostridium chrysemydis]